MRTFLQKKLWRDKMVDIVEQREGSKIYWRQLNDQEFNQNIRIKLLEEAEEVVNAQSRNELIGELADLYEVIDSLTAVNNINIKEIVTEQMRKRDERGGFTGRKFVEKTQHPIGSIGEQYCLANPKKYPEII
jgi:predicted house-cleaning noncanonical NTP pyrophosphatase (MazG superfamily)